MDRTWLLLLISAAVPTLITVVGPHLSARIKVRQETRRTDLEIATSVRDAIYVELERVQGELDEARQRITKLEGTVKTQAEWILRLECALRMRAPDAFTQLKQDYIEDAGG